MEGIPCYRWRFKRKQFSLSKQEFRSSTVCIPVTGPGDLVAKTKDGVLRHKAIHLRKPPNALPVGFIMHWFWELKLSNHFLLLPPLLYFCLLCYIKIFFYWWYTKICLSLPHFGDLCLNDKIHHSKSLFHRNANVTFSKSVTTIRTVFCSPEIPWGQLRQRC